MSKKEHHSSTGIQHALITNLLVLVALIIFTVLCLPFISVQHQATNFKFQIIAEILQIITYGVATWFTGKYLLRKFPLGRRQILLSTFLTAIFLGFAFLNALFLVTRELFPIYIIGAPLSLAVFYLVTKRVFTHTI